MTNSKYQPFPCYNKSMSVLTSLGIVILIMLIMAFLQLVPGVFSLLLHYSFGRFSKIKASDLATFFILGVEVFIVFILLVIYILLSNTPVLLWLTDSPVAYWITAGIVAALGLSIAIFYFRPSSQTELFISRRLAETLSHRAKTIKTRSDAFTLGFISSMPELIFTIPLYIITAVEIMRIGEYSSSRAGLILLFAFAAILPLLIAHCRRSTGYTLADSLRFRADSQNFFRFCLGILYLLVAILILVEVSL